MQFTLDWTSTLGPEEQLFQQLLTFQEAGLLCHTHQLPTVRAVALQLNCSPTVVKTAYQRWQAQGLKGLLLPVIRQAQQQGYAKEQLLSTLDELWPTP